MPRFPPPNDIAFVILEDGKAVPVKSLPKEKWDECRKKMMENVGRIMSSYLSQEA